MVAPFLKQAWITTGVLANIIGLGMIVAYPYSLSQALNSPDSDIKTDVNTASWLASSVGISGIFGYMSSSILMERLGRKLAHLVLTIPGIIGWLVIYYAKDVFSLLIGRLLSGYTTGCTVTLGAVVIGEYTSPDNRGMFLNLKTVATFIGIIILHAVAQYNDWRVVALYCLIPFLVSVVNNLTWPESPSWLASKHRFDECKKSFYWLRGTSEASTKELNALINQNKEVIKCNTSFKRQIINFFMIFKQKNFLKPLFIVGMGFNLLEACGRHSFPSFANDFIKGLTNETDTSKFFYIVLAMDIITLIGCMISCVLVKIIKRRTLLFFSGISGLVILLSIIIFLFLSNQGIIVNNKPWIPLSMFILYLFLVNLGCTPIPLALLGELFPLHYRSVGVTASGMFMSLSYFVTLKTAPLILVTIDVQGAFLIYAIVMFICLLFLYFTLPETKNRTLLEIEDFFLHGKFLDEEKKDVASELMLKQVVT